MLLTGFQEDKMTYRSTRDEYTRVLNDNKSKYYADLIEGSIGDIKKPSANDFGVFLIENIYISLEYSSLSTLAGLSYHICGKLEVALKASPSSQHQHCTDEAQKAVVSCLVSHWRTCGTL